MMYLVEESAAMGGTPTVTVMEPDERSVTITFKKAVPEYAKPDWRRVDNIRAVAAALRTFAETGRGPLPSYHQSDWCYCIAGWTVAVLGKRFGWLAGTYPERAKRLLGLTKAQAANLFAAYWIRPSQAADILEWLADQPTSPSSNMVLWRVVQEAAQYPTLRSV